MTSTFEKVAIREICSRGATPLSPRVEQLVVSSREFTGAGMYTMFENSSIANADHSNKDMYLPGAYIFDRSGEPNSVVILWQDSGRIHMLEVTAIDGERFSTNLEGCNLDFGDGKVLDLTGLDFGQELSL